MFIFSVPLKNNPQQAEIVQLYEDTSAELCRLLARKLGNKQEAEEIAHDAYLKLCDIQHTEEIRDLRKYLFTMSIRMALNVLRRRKVEQNYDNALTASLSEEVDNVSAYRILLAELKLEVVKNTLSELPEKTRYIFLLHRFEGLSYAEIAAKLQVSVKTVEYHISRSLEKLVLSIEEFNSTDNENDQ